MAIMDRAAAEEIIEWYCYDDVDSISIAPLSNPPIFEEPKPKPVGTIAPLNQRSNKRAIVLE